MNTATSLPEKKKQKQKKKKKKKHKKQVKYYRPAAIFCRKQFFVYLQFYIYPQYNFNGSTGKNVNNVPLEIARSVATLCLGSGNNLPVNS